MSQEEQQSSDLYYDWKRLLRKSTMRRVSPKCVWDGSLAILDRDDREIHQLVAKDLVDNDLNGFQIIRETVECDQDSEHSELQVAVTFLKVITHDSLLDCLSIEPYIGTLYSFLGGSNGERGINFFIRLCVSIERFETTEDAIARILECLLKTIQELLNRVQSALHNDMLPQLLALLSARVDSIDAIHNPQLTVNSLRRLLAATSRLVQIPSTADGATSKGVAHSFPHELEAPGGRHDNDFRDATQINILPTLDEITAERSEYLPKTNYLEPHYGANNQYRYLDTAFRLLRHDLFEPLKSDLYNMLKNLESGEAPSKLLRNAQTRAYIYNHARVQHLSVDRRRGLEAIIQFSAPPQLKQKGSKEVSQGDCARWWKDSPRLSEGAVACFLVVCKRNKVKDILFLIVTEKNSDVSKGDKGSHLVAKAPGLPSIGLRLADPSENNFRSLVDLHGMGTQGVLIDLPGLIPATFVPFFKNMQAMLRRGTMAFHQWIVPPDVGCRGEDLTPGAIPMSPPLYAQRRNFAFDLGTIVQGPQSLRFAPSAAKSVDLEEMERLSGLDRGQCQGLVSALSREYALVQGPPGTGKSFLGVKMLQVLLAHKDVLGLGPILIM